MIRLFWVDGRLSWPLVALVAYLSAGLVILDYAWRVIVVQFDTLLLYAFAIAGPLFIVSVAVMVRYRARRTKKAPPAHL
jgi:DMSO/TMAO reductase YedYZ heme-binding membrane subunit